MSSIGYEAMLSPDAIRTLAAQALEILDDSQEDFHAPAQERHRNHIRWWAARETTRFCGAAAALTGDPTLIATLIPLFEIQARFDDFHGFGEAIATGITELVRSTNAHDESVRRLARHENPALREAVASALPPTNEPAIALLERLAQDTSPAVRQAARALLEPVRPVEWWRGKFEHDPFSVLTPAEAAKHAEAIQTLSTLLDKPSWDLGNGIDQVTPLVATLPTSLGLQFAERLLSATELWMHNSSPELLAYTLRTDAGDAVFQRVIERWAQHPQSLYLRAAAGGALPRLPRATRVRVCLGMVRMYLPRFIHGKDVDAAIGYDQFLADVIKKGWPAEVDPTPLLDSILAVPALPNDPHEYFTSSIAGIIEQGPLSLRTQREVLAVVRDGPDARWAERRKLAEKLATTIPPARVRSTALKIIAARGPSLYWALQTWLGRCYDAERDGPRAATAEQLWNDAALRAQLFDAYGIPAVLFAPGRRALRAGTCTFGEAARVLRMIDEFYGGITSDEAASVRRHRLPREVSAERREALARSRGWLGPKSLHGPITDAEWAQYRAARARHTFNDRFDWMKVSQLLPPGPLLPIDRVVLEAGLDANEADANLCVEYGFSHAYGDHATVDDLSAFERMLRQAQRKQHSPFIGMVLEGREAAYKRLGIPLPDEASEAVASDAARSNPGDDEWLDEP